MKKLKYNITNNENMLGKLLKELAEKIKLTPEEILYFSSDDKGFKIYTLLKSKEMTIKEISDKIKLSYVHTQRQIYRLMKLNLIKVSKYTDGKKYLKVVDKPDTEKLLGLKIKKMVDESLKLSDSKKKKNKSV